MKNIKYDKYICDIFITKKLKINNNQIKKLYKYNNIRNYLLNRFDDPENNFSVIIWRIYYKIENRTTCEICNSYTDFDKKNQKYKRFCSIKCSRQSESVKEQYRKTCLEKYGCTNPLHNKEIKEKYVKKWIEKYGYDNPMKSSIIKEKSKQTCLERYGVEYSFQSDNNKIKSKETKLKKYGDEHFINLEKREQTCLEKYGVKHIVQTNLFKEKYKQTCLEKYGVDNYLKTEENIKRSHSNEAINKCNETKKKNGTLNSSKIELKSYDLLKQKYPDVIHQYKDNIRYPFNCDFYIPSLDLFIECQYGQFHHHRPYFGTEEDLKDIEILKENAERRRKETKKEKSRYDNELETWVIRDVNKRNIAKQNNLNYKEFWSILELNKWLEDYEV